MDKITEKYIEAVGRRKTSVARVRLTPSPKTTFSINNKELESYFTTQELQTIAKQPFAEIPLKFKVSARISGGGIHSQAEALRHGVARALI